MLHQPRHAFGAALPEPDFRFAGWRLRPERWELLSPSGKSVPLVNGEMRLLQALVERPGRVLSREFLIEATRGQDCLAYDRAIDVQVCRLRRKLKSAEPSGELLIRTLVGVGYMFTASVAH